MSNARHPLTLADWRRQVAEMYAAVRHHDHPSEAWYDFRARRDTLFKIHPQSPLNDRQRASFVSLPYFAYDPAWRLAGSIDGNIERETFTTHLEADGELRYTRVAKIDFVVQERHRSLSLFWIEGYGGGLFLPFKDASNGRATYGGGRYLYDTIKGADLNTGWNDFILDFNYAYNPSCAYNDQWFCPLAPPENRLSFAVAAGERASPV